MNDVKLKMKGGEKYTTNINILSTIFNSNFNNLSTNERDKTMSAKNNSNNNSNTSLLENPTTDINTTTENDNHINGNGEKIDSNLPLYLTLEFLQKNTIEELLESSIDRIELDKIDPMALLSDPDLNIKFSQFSKCLKSKARLKTIAQYDEEIKAIVEKKEAEIKLYIEETGINPISKKSHKGNSVGMKERKPSTKYVIYTAWKEDGEKEGNEEIMRLSKIAENKVTISTIQWYITLWKKGENIPVAPKN